MRVRCARGRYTAFLHPRRGTASESETEAMEIMLMKIGSYKGTILGASLRLRLLGRVDMVMFLVGSW